MKLCLEIRKNPGNYDLVFKNCGHVAIFTRPNTTFELANVKKFPGSYKGTLEEINSFLNE